MLVVDINQNDEFTHQVHCMLCGTKSVSEDGDITECKHLVYIGISEVEGEPVFDKNNIGGTYIKDGEEENKDYEYFQENLDDNYLCISLHDPNIIPGFSYHIYKVR